MKSTSTRVPAKNESVQIPAPLIETHDSPKERRADLPVNLIETHMPPKSQSAERPAELIDRIRVRAYELYEQRGREDGHEQEDWLQAEAEVVGRLS